MAGKQAESRTAVNGIDTQGIGILHRPARPFWLDVARRLVKEKPLGTWGGACIVLLFVIVAIGAPLLAPYDPNNESATAVFAKPSLTHLFGADDEGRDMLSLVIYGARISLIVGVASVALGTTGATIIGVVSGYFGGITDIVLQRVVDALMAFPSLVLLLLFIAIFGAGLRNVIFAIAFFLIFAPSRIVRSAAIGTRQHVYVEAAQALGASHLRVLLKHILPNVFPLIIVIVTISVGNAILIEASLSFLGLGVPPPSISWGYMLGGSSLAYFTEAPWMAIFPGVALALTVFGFNMFGDALRDVLDPRLRGIS